MTDFKKHIRFDRIAVTNRWKRPKYSRNSDWVIVGVQEWWASHEDFCYKLCLFGIDFQFWFKRDFIQVLKSKKQL
jgi:hypothetical protein